jgi:hypothetical protein
MWNIFQKCIRSKMVVAHPIGFLNTSINSTGSAYIRQAQYKYFPNFRKNINKFGTFNGVMAQSSGVYGIFILSGRASFVPVKTKQLVL